MRSFVLSLGIALVALTVNSDAQVAVRNGARVSAKRTAVRHANYTANSREEVERVCYDEQCGCSGSGYASDGCCGGGVFSGGSCPDPCPSECGCAMGTTTSLPYPRCFNFASPCVSRGGTCDPCCGTIFGEMCCDVKEWLAAMSMVPSAACSGACPAQPGGFRGCCRGGGCGGGGSFGGGFSMPKLCFQDLLAPKCVGGCGSGSKSSLLSGFAGMLLQSSGCTTSNACGGGCRDDSYLGEGYDTGYEAGHDTGYGSEYDTGYDTGYESEYGSEYDSVYESGSSGTTGDGAADSSSNGHRYYATTRQGSQRSKYVTAREYSRIEAQRAAQAEIMARRTSDESSPRAAAPSRASQPRSAHGPTKPQARNRSTGRRTRRAVERASFEEPTATLRLNRPELNEPGAETTPYIEFLDKAYRD